MADVAIVMGSDSDYPVMKEAANLLGSFGIQSEVRVLSAHRSPALLEEFVKHSSAKIFIAAAGGAAHLAGVIASMTTRPVIGVPIPTDVAGGLDSLLSMAQMPSGVPVATMSVGKGGAKNSAILALQMLALSNPEIEQKLREYKKKLSDEVAEKDRKL
jgi:5-(carboxyamino)imidazole ribonucleotide mutase